MIDRDQLIRLSQPVDGVAVSLYLPTHRAGRDTRENPIRYKNHVQEAERRLAEAGWEEADRDAFLAPLSARIEDYDFWQHQQDGLAVFLAEGREPEFVRAPIRLPELTVVGRRFHLAPLMTMLTGVGSFFVLAASLGEARLYRADGDGIERIELPDATPTSFEEATRFDEPVTSVRQHGGNAPVASRAAAAPGSGMVHGTGDRDRDEKEDIRRWFAWLDNGVRERIAGENAPLVFAGVDYLYPLYREANQYPHLADVHVSGNPDEWRDEELHERARDAIRTHFERPRIEAMQRYKELAGTGQAEGEIDRILPAAADGRIDTLIVGVDAHRWGRFDPDDRSVEVLSEATLESEDLLDAAAVHVLRTGGTVFAVDSGHVPDGREAVAILRY